MFFLFISFLTFAYSYSKAINKKITCPRGLYSPVCVTSLFGFQRSLPVNLMYSQHTGLSGFATCGAGGNIKPGSGLMNAFFHAALFMVIHAVVT
jgi:hypothetical protein